MRHRLGWLLALAMASALTGCVERRMVIIADPYPAAAGAIVWDEKNQPLSGSPADKPFTYYGKYNFRIVKDGFEGLDFFSENLIPWTIRDVRYFRYTLTPVQVRAPEDLLREGEQLRAYGKTIGTPAIDPSFMAPPKVLGTPMP
jgi:hypothetical protein